MILLATSGCSGRSERSAGTLLDRSQQDPAISGDGRLLAVISELRGRPSVQLRDLRDGRILPLSQLNRHQPHSSPSLSWNGRYLALITQRGQRRLAVVADRLTGRLHPLPLPGGRDPVKLSLAPDGRQLALQVADQGQWRVELLDLSSMLEADRPGGARTTTPATNPSP